MTTRTMAGALTAAIICVAGMTWAYSLQTVSFQDGDANGYAGTVDTWTGDGSAHGSETTLYFGKEGAPNTHDYSASIRFDSAVSTLPANSFILTASLSLTRAAGVAPSPATEDGSFNGSIRRSAAFTEASTVIGATGNGYTEVGGWAPPAWPNATAHDLDITGFARGWQAGTITNDGVRFVDSGNLQSDIAFHSSEAATVAYRPKLTVQYIAQTSSRERIVVLSGSTVTDDTWLNSASTGSNYGTGSTLQVGRNQPPGGGYGNSLVKFDVASGLQSALGANWNNPVIWQYKGAWMGFSYDGGLTPTSLSFSAYPLSAGAAWTEGGATWATRDGANAWPAAWVAGGVPAGANVAAGTESVVQGTVWNAGNNPAISGMSLWDVSTTTSNFIYGAWTNNGWVIPGYYGTSGNTSGGRSSEGADFTQAGPFLIVVMEIPEPATGVVLGLAGLLALRRGRRA